MININTIYQRVLALANKEQRGYITPQEFNLLANQAQMEIFEQYFYDIEQWGRRPGNEYEYSDMVSNIQEKIAKFQVIDSSFSPSSGVNLDLSQNDIYKLGAIKVSYGHAVNHLEYSIAERVTASEINLYEQSELTKGTFKKPYYVLQTGSFTNNQLAANFYPDAGPNTQFLVSYVRPPSSVQWGYVVVLKKALFDPDTTKTTHFELHQSESNELVYKILKLAGVVIQKNDIVQVAQGLEAAKIQQEKQ